MEQRDSLGWESEKLLRRAAEVLRRNDTGTVTKPAPRLYPHQWNWDSAFIALGLSHIDERRARRELLSLKRGQWQNGMIPHMIFDPSVSGYHPDPEFWGTAGCSDAPSEVRTSGITQPPILARAALSLFENAGNRNEAEAFLREIFPALRRYHTYFTEQRDPLREGLAYINHPWESGMDNSPCWDGPLTSIELGRKPSYRRSDVEVVKQDQRATTDEYDRFAHLVQLYRSFRYDTSRMWHESPFLVQSVLFNSLLCVSTEALAKIGSIIGERTVEMRDRAEELREAVNGKLWHEERGLYLDFDLRAGGHIVKDTIESYAPLYAGIPSMRRAEFMVRSLTDREKYWPPEGHPLCSVSMKEPEFETRRYWRGPVWINMNWIIIRGLERYGFFALARDLKERTLDLVARSGFYEYFDPLTGQGYGGDDFSWTASLTLDLLKTSTDN
jgi:glycogen debranching enzyme